MLCVVHGVLQHVERWCWRLARALRGLALRLQGCRLWLIRRFPRHPCYRVDETLDGAPGSAPGSGPGQALDVIQGQAPDEAPGPPPGQARGKLWTPIQGQAEEEP
jgi:hypothetical protein